eukprot:gene9749-20274_t
MGFVVIISSMNFIPLFLNPYVFKSGNNYPILTTCDNCTFTNDDVFVPFEEHLFDLQTSSILQSALVASIAVTFPIIIDQIMDFVTSAPKSSIDEYIPKRGLVLAVAIIDLLFLLVIIPEGYFLWISPIFNFRDNVIISDLLETVHEIRNSGNIAVDILSEMLDYDKIESRSMQLDLTTVAIKPFVLGCVRPFYLQASSAGVELSLDFDDS